ncbi:PQQ-binding-like beta-propeller repeat protein [Streptomyces sp. NPDC059456]|uniref:outer membrane protein assembly factor BamB family protein n=1 Tax=Streptomyces sp. NPDC059456 TaxID=3346838 RepID=UPI0036B4EF44
MGGGAALWSALAPDRPRRRFAARDGLWKPVVADRDTGTVFAVDGSYRMHALDAATGRSLWERQGQRPAGERFDHGRGRVVVCMDDDLVALDARLGTRLWTESGIGLADVVCDGAHAYGDRQTPLEGVRGPPLGRGARRLRRPGLGGHPQRRRLGPGLRRRRDPGTRPHLRQRRRPRHQPAGGRRRCACRLHHRLRGVRRRRGGPGARGGR